MILHSFVQVDGLFHLSLWSRARFAFLTCKFCCDQVKHDVLHSVVTQIHAYMSHCTQQCNAMVFHRLLIVVPLVLSKTQT